MDPPQDPAIVSAQRPLAVYTRTQLLSLYTSPLVPNKLDGMKEFEDWHGEFFEPPSPPAPQRHGLPSRNSERSERGERSTPRRLHGDAANSPFANFGRFGVDGGLGDGSLEPRRRGLRSARDAADSADKDLAPHLRGAGERGSLRDRGAAGEPSSPTKEQRGFAFGSEREHGERGKLRNGDRELGSRRGEPDRRRDEIESGVSKRDIRRGLGPADEGGWRNVGMTREEREKRLTRNHSSTSGTLDSSRRERFEREPASRSGRPAWMDEDSPAASGSGSSPAWMDAPATGNLSFDNDGHVRDGAKRRTSPKEKEDAPPRASGLAAFSTSSGKGGMDSLQAFKAQMKERERKDRERELRAAGLPVERDDPPATSPPPGLEPASSKSIFEDLGISRATVSPPGLGGATGASAEEGGRSSRFARFFDGKPAGSAQASPQPAAQQPPASVFGSLMAGMGGGASSASSSPGPSKEDADSMARLLGMLQVSGARASSPLVSKSPSAGSAAQQAMSPPSIPSQAPSTAASPAPTASSATRADEGRSTSRFNFSNRSAVASPAAPQAPSLQSPFLAAAAPPVGFGLPSPGAPSPAAPHEPRSPQQPRSAQSNGASPPMNQGQGTFSPPPPPPGMPPQFFGAGGPQRFPPPMPGQLPPGMPPPFAFGPDGRPIPPPPHPGMLPPFGSPNGPTRPNGPLSPPLASPNGPPPPLSPGAGPRPGQPPFFPGPPPPHLMFPHGAGGMPPPPPGGMPFPPPPPPHLQGRMAGAPPPPPMFTAGNNPGADLMALLNSGAGGQRIGADGPPQGVQVGQMRPS
ncbi:hypothetical protein Rhopal_006571-T1 [Rhodotorula paludigena]|uniref:Uncharacterized protein n=1 Tax=Rhodotorula paludigena TaxID=86838 RepID=A0AAV5GWF1_9BASI|nr:hypothetical protein Rhopal_006571-T1 [Rhodotorula paludigena]